MADLVDEDEEVIEAWFAKQSVQRNGELSVFWTDRILIERMLMKGMLMEKSTQNQTNCMCIGQCSMDMSNDLKLRFSANLMTIFLSSTDVVQDLTESLTAEQICELEKQFSLNENLTRSVRIALARRLNVDEQVIRCWFSRRLAKSQMESMTKRWKEKNGWLQKPWEIVNDPSVLTINLTLKGEFKVV